MSDRTIYGLSTCKVGVVWILVYAKGLIAIRSLKDASKVRMLSTINDQADSRVALSASGRALFVASYDDGIARYDTESLECVWERKHRASQSLHCSEDGNTLYVEQEQRGIAVLDTYSGDIIRRYRSINSLQYCNGHLVGTCGKDITCIDTKTENVLFVYSYTASMRCACIAGGNAIICFDDGTLHIVSVASGELVERISGDSVGSIWFHGVAAVGDGLDFVIWGSVEEFGCISGMLWLVDASTASARLLNKSEWLWTERSTATCLMRSWSRCSCPSANPVIW
jgi:WD40 repeat protein